MHNDTMFVTLVLDESGSMSAIREQAIAGYNAYVKGVREMTDPPNRLFTLIKFDSTKVEVVHRALPIAEVPPLESFSPGAWTPLIDASVKAIKATAERAPLGARVVVVIQTDGQENASREFTLRDLQDLITAKTSEGWHFIFLGVGPDAFNQARQIGVLGSNTMRYHPEKISESFYAAVVSTSAYALSGDTFSSGFSDQDRKMSGGYAMPTPDPTPPNPTPPDPDVAVEDIVI